MKAPMKCTSRLGKLTGYALAAVIGILTGIITLIGQKYLPVNMNFLANSASMWSVPAFLVPYCLRSGKRQSSLQSTAVLVVCVLSYHTFEALLNHHAYSVNRHQLLWLCCALIGGMVIGLCVNLAQTKNDIIGDLCRNILPAIFAAEASSKLFHISDYRHMIAGVCLQLCIGLALYALINRKNVLKKENVLSFIALLILGSVAFELLWRFV